jgi:glycosyltransferase involved in cell wall biosynthesis
MGKVLLIANNFMPYEASLGSCIRAITLADFLTKNDYEVTLLSQKGQKVSDLGYQEVLEKLDLNYVSPEQADLSDWFLGNLKLFSCGVIIPETRAMIYYRMFRVALELIEDKGIVDVIITTPTHHAQLIGLFLKQRLKDKINLIVDYRDSWFTNNFYRKKGRISRYFSEHKEKAILNSCDYFTYISEPMLTQIISQYGLKDFEQKTRLIMNGYNKEVDLSSIEKNKNGPIKIGYFGLLTDAKNSFRNIETLIAALKEKPELQDEMEFYFYGDVRLNNTSLDGVKNIHIKSSVPHDEALKLMANMDYLLIVHSNPATSEEVITGKFFEYVSVKVPVLNLTPSIMEANKLVKQYGIGKVVDITTSASVKKGLSNLTRMPDCYENIDVTSFSREHQYKIFLECLKSNN